MKHILKETIKIIAILAIAIPTFAFLAGSWTEPVQSPPGTNVDAPINVGFMAQTKEGGLWLNTLGAAVGLIVDKGNVGIGTAEPAQKLDVAGKISIGNDAIAPTAGTIRWTGLDLEVYMGGDWVSLTGASLAPTCTDFTYSTWGACQPGNTQTRSITSYIPAGCTGGTPETLTQSCTYNPCYPNDQVTFGGATICLADGATASASCTNTVPGPEDTSAYVYVLSNARYISGQIQTKLFVSSGNNIISCDSGWRNGLTASITNCSTNSSGSTFESRFSGSSQTSSNGVSGNGTHYKRVYISDGGSAGLTASCSTPTGAWH